MKSLDKKQYIGVILMAATILFLWGNSLLPTPVSAEVSSGLSRWLEAVFGPSAFIRFVAGNIRKIAHFTLYGILGVETVLTTRLARGLTARRVVQLLYFALTIAFVDESLQVLSGRGPMIQDVWLDLSGFTLLGGITLLLALAGRAFKTRSRQS